jgi:hypothetical protein
VRHYALIAIEADESPFGQISGELGQTTLCLMQRSDATTVTAAGAAMLRVGSARRGLRRIDGSLRDLADRDCEPLIPQAAPDVRTG